MTSEQCSDLEALAGSLEVAFSAIETGEGYLVFLGEADLSFERYSEGVIYLMGLPPAGKEWLRRGDEARDLDKAECYLEVGLLEEAWEAIAALPWKRWEDADVWTLRLEILAKQGKWDVIYAMALEAAELNGGEGDLASVPAEMR